MDIIEQSQFTNFSSHNSYTFYSFIEIFIDDGQFQDSWNKKDSAFALIMRLDETF